MGAEEQLMHREVILAHEEKFKNYDKQIEVIFTMLKEASDVVNKHICGSADRIMAIVAHSGRIDQLEKDVTNIQKGHKEIRGWAVSILITLLGTAFYIANQTGQYKKQIEINTGKIVEFEILHPRIK